MEQTPETNINREHVSPEAIKKQGEIISTLKTKDSLSQAIEVDGEIISSSIEKAFATDQVEFKNKDSLKKAQELLKSAPHYAKDTSVRQINYQKETGEQKSLLVRKFSFESKSGKTTQVTETFTETNDKKELIITNYIFNQENRFLNLNDLVPNDCPIYHLIPPKKGERDNPGYIIHGNFIGFMPGNDPEEIEHASILHEIGHSQQNRSEVDKPFPSFLKPKEYKKWKEKFDSKRPSEVKLKEKRKYTEQHERNAWAFAVGVFRKSRELGIDLEPKNTPLKNEVSSSYRQT